MSAAVAALALLKAIQIPLELLRELDLDKPLWPPEKDVKNNSCFDYIIIGAGTAGCVVANRLTENENHNVLVLEAGGDPPIETFLPPLFFTAVRSALDWNYTSTYDRYAASGQDYYTKFTAGKCLGGSSTIDHFIEVRGSPCDYDSWARIVNDSSWKYSNVLPYFKKKETIKDLEILNSPYLKYHGTNGPTGLARQPFLESKPILGAFNETGNPVLLDLNGYDTLGYTESLLQLANGVRQDTAFNYLTPIKLRPNLYVMRYTLATRIIFENKRAVAVVTVRDGKIYVYKASKEIIVCAGVYNSPKLLMLSGIGHKNYLKGFDIETVADLPVGDNFQDQVAVPLVHRTIFNILPPPPQTLILTKVPFPILVGLKALKTCKKNADCQVFSLILSHDLPFVILACAIVFQFRPEICDKFNTANTLHNTLFSVMAITQPKSSGTVRLNSINPYDKPLITTKYFRNKKDLKKMVGCVKDFIKVGNSTYFKKVGAKLIDLELDACKKYMYATDEYWECYILNTAGSIYHTGGTCSMKTVVDSRLKVLKVTNLRVIDASIMPHLTSGSPHEAVLMIAEKGSDMIKEDANDESTCKQMYADDPSVVIV